MSPTSIGQEEEGVPDEAEESSLDEEEDRISLIKTLDSKAAKHAGKQTIDSKAAMRADKQGTGGGSNGDGETGSMNEKGTNYRVFNVWLARDEVDVWELLNCLLNIFDVFPSPRREKEGTMTWLLHTGILRHELTKKYPAAI